PAGEEHQALAVRLTDGTHRLRIPYCSWSAAAASPRPCPAASPPRVGRAAAPPPGVPGRRRRTQPATFRCWARATAMAPAGTSAVITEPAAVYAPFPTVTGATNMLSAPVRAWSAIVVGCLGTPSWR